MCTITRVGLTLSKLSIIHLYIINSIDIMFKFVTKVSYSISKQSNIIFFGSGKIAYPTLHKLFLGYTNLSVVTQNVGKNKLNEVKTFCEKKNIVYGSPVDNRSDKQTRFEDWSKYKDRMGEPDLGIVCSYGNMIPARIIDKFKYGVIIVHPSLLPKYRGGSPIFHAVANGDPISGISYIEASKGRYDQGALLHQVQYPIGLQSNLHQVEQRLANEAAEHINYVIQNLQKLRPGKNQKDLQTYIAPHLLKAPIFKQKKLDLNMRADQVYHWSRALVTPKVYFNLLQNDLIIKLANEYLDGEGKVGSLITSGKKLFVRCEDRYVRIVGWQEPTRIQVHPGVFIARYLKSGKYAAEDVYLS